jgi:hypothetical protein
MLNPINAVKSINTAQTNTTQTKDFDLTDDKTTPLELLLFTLPVNNDLALFMSSQPSEKQRIKGSLVIKSTNEEIPFDFEVHCKQMSDSNGEVKYILDSFTGKINNQVAISGVSNSNGPEGPVVTNIRVDINGKSNSFVSKLNVVAESNKPKIFSNVIEGNEGALKEETTFYPVSLAKLLKGGVKVFETKAEVLGTTYEQVAESKGVNGPFITNINGESTRKPIEFKLTGKWGNNNLNGTLALTPTLVKEEKDYGEFLIRYTYAAE